MNKGTKKAETTKEERNYLVDQAFTVENVRLAGKNDICFFTLVINEIVKIYNCRVVEGKKGDFISFPNQKNGDNYYNHAFCYLSDDNTKYIIGLVEEALK